MRHSVFMVGYFTVAAAAVFLMYGEAPAVYHAVALALACLLCGLLAWGLRQRDQAREAARMLGWEEKAPPRSPYLLRRVWRRGVIGQGGYGAQLTVRLSPKHFYFRRDLSGVCIILLGIRVKYTRSYGGFFG